jgi:hypothetical protein
VFLIHFISHYCTLGTKHARTFTFTGMKAQATSPPNKRYAAYSRKNPDTNLQKAEKLFTKWLNGRLRLDEGTPDTTIALMLGYLGIDPAKKTARRVRLAQLLEALAQCPVIRRSACTELLRTKDKVTDGLAGAHALPPILGRSVKVPTVRDQSA